IVAGNSAADQSTMAAVVPNLFEQACLSHSFYHQNAIYIYGQQVSLQKSFCLTKTQARDIIHACPDCQLFTSLPTAHGVNPQGLSSNEAWQTDVTHIPFFGTLKYLH
ncbi:POK7 protein, partial [Campylorhamphus procurvoides]|nr:POK7 protein [Campylorhamphus procurvoides]